MIQLPLVIAGAAAKVLTLRSFLQLVTEAIWGPYGGVCIAVIDSESGCYIADQNRYDYT